MEIVHEDMGEANMECTNHPYRSSSTPGGICALCLQEKLGKLVSSSFPVAIFPSTTSSSSSPSPNLQRSDFGKNAHISTHNNQKEKNKNDGVVVPAATMSSTFKRSKSTTISRRTGMHSFLNEDNRRGFWSFLYLSKHSTAKKINYNKDFNFGNLNTPISVGSTNKRENDDDDDDEGTFDRKVSRSRSVGCGSRSFSGDLFERISTGFGDCALRRVESQREGKIKRNGNGNNVGQDCIKERVRCGGIFSGFMITSSSSYNWDNYNNNDNVRGKEISAVHSSMRHLSSHGRSKSWGWAFASPMRAFAKQSAGKRGGHSSKNNAPPNLAAIPSLLAVSG